MFLNPAGTLDFFGFRNLVHDCKSILLEAQNNQKIIFQASRGDVKGHRRPFWHDRRSKE